MATTFSVPINNIRTTLASSHTSGSGTLAVATGTGVNFGSTFPVRVTAITAATYGSIAESLTIFSVTARATDSLTVSVIEGTTDQNYSIGDVVEMRVTAGALSDLDTAVNALENHLSGVTAHAVMLGEGTTTPGAATIGTAERVLTDGGAGVDPSFVAPVTSNYVSGTLSSAYNCTTSFANTGLSITLPSGGTYMIMANVRCSGTLSGVAGNWIAVQGQFYDSTNSVLVTNSTVLMFFFELQATVSNIAQQNTFTIGPLPYGPLASAATIQLQANYIISGTYVGSQIAPVTTLTAFRIS